ncbi:MAG: hypothetical protein WD027_10175 [Gaiellales bacterium]
MFLDELRPGLWRWTAAHPDWEANPESESPADWPRDVGCVAYAAADGFVFVDPLVATLAGPFWAQLDELVERHGGPVSVVTTLQFHRRSRDEVAARYEASTSRARKNLPKGVEPIRVPRAGETMIWLPEPQALIPGDRILGDGQGGLRLCPESWLRYLTSRISLSELREELRPLLDLPVELVLVSHGEPVLRSGRDALVRALSGG